MLGFPRKHPLITGGILGGVALLWYLWPEMPRASYLASGCTLKTTGTIAATLGGIFTVLLRVLIFAGGWVIGLCWAAVLREIGRALIRGWHAWRRYLHKRAERKLNPEPKPPRKPTPVKPDLVSGKRYAEFFPHSGPGFLMRRYLSLHRTFLRKTEDFLLTVTVSYAIFWVVVCTEARDYVCLETTGQSLAYRLVIFCMWAVTSAATAYTWLLVSPREKVRESMNARYGDLEAFKGGVLKPSVAIEFPLYRLAHLGGSDYRDAGDVVDAAAAKFAKQVFKHMTQYVSVNVNDDLEVRMLIRVLANDAADRRWRFRATARAGELVVGPIDENGDTISGVILRIPETTRIRNFLHGSFSIIRDLAHSDPELAAAIQASEPPQEPKAKPTQRKKRK